MLLTCGAGGGWSSVHELIRPLDEVLHVGCVGVSSVVLAPGKFAIEEAHVDCGHLLGVVVVGDAEGFCAEQLEDGLGCDGSHVAALMIEPLGVTALWDAVADEGEPRGAEGEQLV